MAGLELALVDQHPVGGEVGEPVGGGVGPGEVLRAGEELLRLHLGELGEGAPGRLVAPDLLARRGERVEAVHLDVLVGGLVAVDDDLVAGLPAGDALADLPDDPGGVGAADVVAVLGVVAVAEDRDRLAERRPDVVEVDAGRHHPDDHLEGARLGDLDLLELEGVGRLALALLADHPGRHRLRQRAGLNVKLRDCAGVDGQGSSAGRFGSGRRILVRHRSQPRPNRVSRPAAGLPSMARLRRDRDDRSAARSPLLAAAVAAGLSRGARLADSMRSRRRPGRSAMPRVAERGEHDREARGAAGDPAGASPRRRLGWRRSRPSATGCSARTASAPAETSKHVERSAQRPRRHRSRTELPRSSTTAQRRRRAPSGWRRA